MSSIIRSTRPTRSEHSLRILIHAPFFHPLVGGMETFADGLAGELARRGESVTVYAETPLGTAAELDRSYRILRSADTPAKEALAQADVLLAVGPGMRIVPTARKMGVPFVLIHQSPAADCPIGIGWRNGATCSYSLLKCLGCRVSGQSTKANVRNILRYKAQRWAIVRAAANVYISEYVARRAGVSGTVIPNFYDASIFSPDERTAREKVFLFVGRLVPIKGVEVALRGFASARRQGSDYRFRIVGDGPERENLQKLARTEGIADAVEFVGIRKGSELAAEYRRAEALLFPSQWEEPFGIVMAEAMACGTPVIASNHGACPEVVGDTGLLVPPADVEAWARAMLEFPARRAELAPKAAAWAAANFPLSLVAERYLGVLESIRAPAKEIA